MTNTQPPQRINRFIKIAILTVCCLFLTGAQKDLTNTTLHLDNRTLQLHSPIIEKDHVMYLPLREFAKSMKWKSKYSRKNDQYHLSFQNTQTTLIPNAREIWVNNTRHYLAQPTFSNRNQLYVPLESFLSLMGYMVTHKKYRIEISKNTNTYSTHNEALKEEGHILDVLDFSKPRLKELSLPKLYKEEDTYLAFELRSYAITSQFLYEDDILFLNLDTPLQKEGFTISKSDTTYTISLHKTSWTFDTTKPQITKKKGTQISKIESLHPAIKRNGQTYIPFKAFLAALDLSFDWSPKTRTITLLYKIQNIYLSEEDNELKLKIKSSLGLKGSDPVKLDKEKGFFLDIDFSYTPNTITQALNANSPIKQVSIKQINSATTRLTIKLKEWVGVFPLIPTQTGGEITFHTSITDLDTKVSHNKTTITIKGNSHFTYTPWLTDDKSKLVIDIPKTINDLPLFIRETNPSFKRIRTSQFQVSPPITRIVFDLNTPPPAYSFSRKNDQTLAITLEAKSATQKPTAPKVAKTTKTKAPAIKPPKPKKKLPELKPTPPLKPNIETISRIKGPLENKVIAIDPGHGGSDPGAVIKRTVFEKKYTMDISKRLKRLLEKEGASVVMLRSGDRHVSLQKRVYIANRNKADAFISIHVNSFDQPGVHGSESFYYKPKDLALSKAIHKELTKDLKRRNIGVKRSRFYVLRNTRMPATLIEPLFMTNPKEYKLLQDPHYREKMAQSIANGLKNYFKNK